MCFQSYTDPAQTADVNIQQTDVKTEEDNFVPHEQILHYQQPCVQPLAVGNMLHSTWLIYLNCLA